MKSAAILVAFFAFASPAISQTNLSSTDRTAAFRAGGFKLERGQWRACGDPGTPSYSPGTIETVRDLNGDGQVEAVITEGGTYCFGMTGTGFTIVSKQASGDWKLITASQGIPNFLRTKGVGGWPDIEIGGPGFCFPVERWNGREYALSRHQYEGKPCRPS
ncbi:hypothetical protein [Sphingobium vermicomposti]|uniref:hypothetical protein n=1 Tax=Sphingobium vermicomposti TaxID=529005 RepID=UPI00141ED939|nr:hypothetical protein [Sphingobium vermicomposti]